MWMRYPQESPETLTDLHTAFGNSVNYVLIAMKKCLLKVT